MSEDGLNKIGGEKAPDKKMETAGAENLVEKPTQEQIEEVQEIKRGIEVASAEDDAKKNKKVLEARDVIGVAEQSNAMINAAREEGKWKYEKKKMEEFNKNVKLLKENGVDVKNIKEHFFAEEAVRKLRKEIGKLKEDIKEEFGIDMDGSDHTKFVMGTLAEYEKNKFPFNSEYPTLLEKGNTLGALKQLKEELNNMKKQKKPERKGIFSKFFGGNK